MDGSWTELADGVLARRHAELDLTTGLVLGGDRALVIDTRGDDRQGAELAGAVRELTALPVLVVITHAHFDHCFGTSAFPGSPVYAQAGCAAAVAVTVAAQKAQWVRHYRDTGDRDTADALAGTTPVLPDHPVCPRPGSSHHLDLGGRVVELLHPGPAHTGHDLAVHVPDAAVLFAGDLLENGAPPSVGPDAYPGRWADALAEVLTRDALRYVPGHGDPMTPGEAARQQASLARPPRAAP
ncbi:MULTISPECIES: MBL fold metallo-hydrolase [Pseudonocardia]|uniref:Beta-lactamase 2 n=2 Tax=Pseudonocardia TaxID=1847 RepID=A0A1Y2N8D0_PSEAH|nr:MULTISPECIES: MBL fold metallo-hydrolase [Pseudonocardia]OSY43704.1 Beta-lactamase 2 precursor [Pseudonocardia autotrophica]TDN73307.1 glyoxylase-like metal-dependent hydrolase (beta-lactamase superfamily II) [Pseudonocardia autotrophica]BBG04043.1 MBL fold metallo-hydrolase [Pseudonocardia autotrophica]GEC29396.1 MBL fold metallo-hydrolase [Pseudonocardia saturnea]